MVDAPKNVVSTTKVSVPDLKDKHINLLKGKTVQQIKKIFPTAHVMDYDGNGTFNIGDTVDLENPSTGKTKSYHIVKKGESGGNIEGNIETAEYESRKRFTMRTKDKSFADIKKTYVPSMEIFEDANKDGKFNSGDSLTEKLPDGKSRKYYFVKSGDTTPKIVKNVTGSDYSKAKEQELTKKVKDQNHINNDSYFDCDKVVSYTLENN